MVKRDIMTNHLNKFLACVLISETLAVNTGNEMKELEFIRQQLSELDMKAAEKFGDWVDSFEHHLLAISDNETLLPIMLMKAAVNGRKFKTALLTRNPRNPTPQMRHTKPDTRNPAPEALLPNLAPETRHPKPHTRNPAPEVWSQRTREGGPQHAILRGRRDSGLGRAVQAPKGRSGIRSPGRMWRRR